MGDTGNSAALQIIGNFVMQAAAQGDTAGMLDHLTIYMAAVKADREHAEKGRG